MSNGFISKTALIIILIAVFGGLFIYRYLSSKEPLVKENDQSNQKEDLIRVTNPKPNEIIKSPYSVRGEARGNWFFEASFPVRLVDSNGKILILTFAQAQGEWMTTDFVPFESSLSFEIPETEAGELILQKDNPSGLPEYDDEIVIPVRFR
ncbi:MAG: Gmad2 immunoglobulin-like domain-containing protein [Candidatus Pacebacteria bacterium]|nr:Gmad2 immunoglobulin-like domain-containing protein [Candidatus Paceibacterota bacterium]